MIGARNDLVIGFDLDGVIIDHTQNKIRVAAELGVLLDIFDTPTDILNIKYDSAIVRQIDKTIYDEPRIALNPPLYSGAVRAISQVRKLWPYYLISRRTANECALKLLEKYGLWPRFFNEKNTFFVISKEEKNLKAKELGVNIYIDDQPSVLARMIDVPHRLLLDPLMVYPEDGAYKKISSWSEFLPALEKL